MDQKTHSPKFLRHRKFMLVLPLLALPFVALLFWSFGGGRGSAAGAENVTANKGLNAQLPDAVLKHDPSLTKMSFYNQAASDSLKKSELMRTDPFFNLPGSPGMQADSVNSISTPKGSLGQVSGIYPPELSYKLSSPQDPNEAKVYSRIEALNKAMKEASNQPAGGNDSYSSYSQPATGAIKTADVDRLEQMMNVMKNSSGGEDQEMQQLNGMLDKIMDIQHPDRIREVNRQESPEPNAKVLAVTAPAGRSIITLLEKPASKGSGRIYRRDTIIPPVQNGFYPLDTAALPSQSDNAIDAVIHETQSLVSGATVKMRLLSDISVDGVLIPKDNFVYGTATLSDERLKITIASVRYQHSVFSVKLNVYDMDGMEGIFIPGSVSRDVAKTSADQALQGVGLSSLSPSLPIQAAGAGIQAAKSLLSRKVRLVRVSVKAGYQVLLKAAN